MTITANQHKALFAIMLSVVMLSVVMLSDIMMSVITQCVMMCYDDCHNNNCRHD
jgi:hypothetical protein